MRRTQKLRFLNATIWIVAITVSLFIIGFVTRIGSEWSKTPVDRIGTNNFQFYIADERKYYIYFECESEDITVSYKINKGSFKTFPDEVDLLDKAVRWTAVHDGEVFSASLSAPFVFSGKEALKTFNAYDRKRLNNVRLFHRAAKNRWLMLGVLSLGGFWIGDLAASHLDVPCQRSKDLDWLKKVDWKALTRAIYDHRAHEVGRCVTSLNRKLEQTKNSSLLYLKEKYFGSDNHSPISLSKNMNRSDLIIDLIKIFPSPEMSSLLPDDDFDITFDIIYDVTGKEIAGISKALDECRRIAAAL